MDVAVASDLATVVTYLLLLLLRLLYLLGTRSIALPFWLCVVFDK